MVKKPIIVLAAVFFILSGCVDESAGPSPAELKRQVLELSEENSGLKDRINALQTEIDELNSTGSSLKAENNALRKELSVLKSRAAGGRRR